MIGVSALLLVDDVGTDRFNNVNLRGVIDTFTATGETSSPDEPGVADRAVRLAAAKYPGAAKVFVCWRVPPAERGRPWAGRLTLHRESDQPVEIVVGPVDTGRASAKWVISVPTLPLLGCGENLLIATARRTDEPASEWSSPLAEFCVTAHAEIKALALAV